MTEAVPAKTPDENYQKIIRDNIYPDPGLSDDQQRRFTHRYSFAALVLQFVYFFAMGDGLLAWLSIGCSVIYIFSPLLLIFPIWARRRAFASRRWSGFNEFYYAQKKWDRLALYLLIALVVLGLITFWLIGPTVINSFHTLTGQTTSGGSLNQQVQDAVRQYQSILGQ